MTSFQKITFGIDKGSKCGLAALYEIRIGLLGPQIYLIYFNWSKIILFCIIRYLLLLARDRDAGTPPPPASLDILPCKSPGVLEELHRPITTAITPRKPTQLTATDAVEINRRV